MRQARLALLQTPATDEAHNNLLAQTSSIIDAMPEPQRSAAQIEWEYAHVVDRQSPLIAQLAAELGLDDAALDALFAQARQL